jgi:hypothetical protein
MTWNVGLKLSTRPSAFVRTVRFVAAGVLLSSGLFGCTDSPGSISTIYPVKGQILMPDGKPLTSGTVVFVSNRGQEFSGKLESDGRFSLKSGLGDGAPDGEYLVRLDAEPQSASSATRAKKGAAALPFPAKYADETTSDVKVNVKPGENNLEPIKLLPARAAAKSTHGKD